MRRAAILLGSPSRPGRPSPKPDVPILLSRPERDKKKVALQQAAVSELRRGLQSRHSTRKPFGSRDSLPAVAAFTPPSDAAPRDRARVHHTKVPATTVRTDDAALVGGVSRRLPCPFASSLGPLQLRQPDPLARRRLGFRTQDRGALDRRGHGGTDHAVQPVVVPAVGADLPFVHRPATTFGLDAVLSGQMLGDQPSMTPRVPNTRSRRA